VSARALNAAAREIHARVGASLLRRMNVIATGEELAATGLRRGGGFVRGRIARTTRLAGFGHERHDLRIARDSTPFAITGAVT